MNPINSIAATLTNTLNNIILFLPQFISGLIILIVGVIVAGIARAVVRKGADYLQMGKWLRASNVENGKTTKMWVDVLS